MPARPSLLRPLSPAGFSRAMGGSRLWSVLMVVAVAVRVVRWLRRDDERPLYRTVVRPGDRFEIVARAPR